MHRSVTQQCWAILIKRKDVANGLAPKRCGTLCSRATGRQMALLSMPYALRESIAGRHALHASLAASKSSFFPFPRPLNNKDFERAGAAGRALSICATHVPHL
jgi:hypothetical protein